MYRCWKSVPKSERQEVFDFYTSLPKVNDGAGPFRITAMYVNEYKRNKSRYGCPFGVLLSMHYSSTSGFDMLAIPSTIEKWLEIPERDVARFMRAHDMKNPTDAELARMMGVEYSGGRQDEFEGEDE